MSKIEVRKGNLLDSDSQAIVNTVNTVGVMGKGIALLFKKAYPENFKNYRKECLKKNVKVGRMLEFKVGNDDTSDLFNQTMDSNKSEHPMWIINFPTKQHWRSPSNLQWIEQGLNDLKRVIDEHNIQSIALPQLGCGNGGLDWKDVEPKIQKAFADSDVRVIVYESPKEIFQ